MQVYVPSPHCIYDKVQHYISCINARTPIGQQLSLVPPVRLDTLDDVHVIQRLLCCRRTRRGHSITIPNHWCGDRWRTKRGKGRQTGGECWQRQRGEGCGDGGDHGGGHRSHCRCCDHSGGRECESRRHGYIRKRSCPVPFQVIVLAESFHVGHF